MNSNRVLSPLAGLEGAWQHTRVCCFSALLTAQLNRWGRHRAWGGDTHKSWAQGRGQRKICTSDLLWGGWETSQLSEWLSGMSLIDEKEWLGGARGKGKAEKTYFIDWEFFPWATGQAVIFKVAQSTACPTLAEPQHRAGPYTLFLSMGVLGRGLSLWNHTLSSLMIESTHVFFSNDLIVCPSHQMVKPSRAWNTIGGICFSGAWWCPGSAQYILRAAAECRPARAETRLSSRGAAPLQGTQKAADLRLLAYSYKDPMRREVEAGPFYRRRREGNTLAPKHQVKWPKPKLKLVCLTSPYYRNI